MARRNNSKKNSCSNCEITGCSPQCPFFPNADGEVKWHVGEDGLKHRDEPLISCGYNGSYITSWNRICPWKEDKKNLLLEKKKQEENSKKNNSPVSNSQPNNKSNTKKNYKKKSYRKKINKPLTD